MRMTSARKNCSRRACATALKINSTKADEGDGPTAVLFADDDHRGADFEPLFGGGDSAAGLELDDDFELAEEIDDDRPVDAPLTCSSL